MGISFGTVAYSLHLTILSFHTAPPKSLNMGRNGCGMNLRQIQNHIAHASGLPILFNTLRTGDADLRFYITTVQDG